MSSIDTSEHTRDLNAYFIGRMRWQQAMIAYTLEHMASAQEPSRPLHPSAGHRGASASDTAPHPTPGYGGVLLLGIFLFTACVCSVIAIAMLSEQYGPHSVPALILLSMALSLLLVMLLIARGCFNKRP